MRHEYREFQLLNSTYTQPGDAMDVSILLSEKQSPIQTKVRFYRQRVAQELSAQHSHPG